MNSLIQIVKRSPPLAPLFLKIEKKKRNQYVPDFYLLTDKSFIWHNTHEGHGFWSNVRDRIKERRKQSTLKWYV